MLQAEPTHAPLHTHASISLHQLAHARAGDKGERLNVALFAYEADHYATLLEQVTEERVLALFSHRGASRVRRYPLPNLAGMNFVIDDVLQGGVNGALNLDGHGKTLSFLLLSLEVHL
ncbi:AtuA-related protein [Vreelandella arctica]|uniref:AtuA-related protein n=1 Tax=Vreelandella arctica TaxID=3126499 RepID=UPI00300E6599|tara:strand:+ start:5819 stop:6172 length:354 start_codon:yes stop_codon:yes gene_type:complete